MSVELTRDEARALLALLDIAVKAAGLQVAQAAAELAAKVEPATRDEPEKVGGTD